ncbi:hypothetical protein B0H66DRAFT_560033 [Apodospora peruviana]|uniref:Peptidase metallopeptidase domain-containing protein n=1 Tax=Apodospora peruviana TaxID=516989 RepID=A0AAE0I004_9PEZI|nr:hypothetical protein B0H66DRAFT_560033 [Apodospora peruviana]
MALFSLPFVLPLLSLVGLLAQGCPGPDSAHGISFPEGFLRNDTALHKRWTAIVPGDGTGTAPVQSNGNGKLWPQGYIRACIDPAIGPLGRADAMQAIHSGMEAWYTAGLHRSAFKVEVFDAARCASAGVTGPKKDYLWVKWAGMTPTGGWVAPSCSLGNLNTGSIMSFQNAQYFTVHTAPGSTALARSTNFALTHAHELGHLFGLVHEHQNPTAWPRFSGGLDAGNGILSFFCENLSDYDACLQERTTYFASLPADPARLSPQDYLENILCAEYLDSVTEMCQGGAPAGGVYDPTRGDHFLNSRDWLPYPGGNQFINYQDGGLDLLSIMIYDSLAGAKAAPGSPVYTIRRERTDYVGKPGTDAVAGREHHIKTGDPGIPGSNMNRPTNGDVLGATLLSDAVMTLNLPANQVPYFSAGSSLNAIWHRMRGREPYCRVSNSS